MQFTFCFLLMFTLLAYFFEPIRAMVTRPVQGYQNFPQQRRPTRRMLPDVFIEITEKHFKTLISYICSPRKGTLTLTPGMGGGVGGTIQDQRSQNISKKPKQSQNKSSENCSHFWDIFLKMFKNIFKKSSYIEKTTPNPINALKITTVNTKHTNNTKRHFLSSEHFENAIEHF